jgi:hypothetical protein
VLTGFKALLVLVLLAVPLLVISSLPGLFEFASSVPAPKATSPTAVPKVANPTLTPDRGRLSALNETAPPTLSPPLATATAVGTPRPTPTGEKVIVANTGGVGAVLRKEPVTGQPVAALREQQVLEVLEHRNVPGSGDWLHVRAPDGAEGWVTSLAARPAPASTQ